MRVAGESVLTDVGLRPRHVIALTMLRDQGEVSQAGLADLLQVDRTNLVGLLNELEAEQLIERRRSVQDRRRHEVVLTDTGRRRLAEAEFALAAVEESVLGALDAEQREALYALLRQATDGHAGGCVPDC
jgi:DNA-binding MarR family transcriptional regulator